MRSANNIINQKFKDYFGGWDFTIYAGSLLTMEKIFVVDWEDL